MKIIYFYILLILVSFGASGQTYKSDSLSVHFFANTPISEIDAISNSGFVELNTSTKEVRFSIPVKSFTFKKALMQQHFNDKHMESHRYPNVSLKAYYKEALDLAVNKTIKLVLTGKLNMHGVNREISIPSDVSIKNGNMYVNAYLKIKPKDYNIKSPMVFNTPVAEEIEVTVSGVLKRSLPNK